MRILVTSALPYANGEIHLGHLAGAYLPADVYVRYQRARGRDVIHICGTDEHGVAITVMAEKQKIKPQQIVDRYYESIRRSFAEFGIIFDNFSRTTRPRHYRVAQEFFSTIHARGYIEAREIEQFYCPRCKRFLPDRYVVGRCPNCGNEGARGDQCEACGRWLEPFQLLEARCLVCGAPPDRRRTKHWYFKLSQFQDRLTRWIDAKSDWKDHVLQAVRSWLKEGLEDRPITRDISWGVPVPLPEATGKVLYVWFDAPIGYISATMEWAEQQGAPDRWKDYWCDPATKIVHFIGKDNIVFHTLIWPAMLMAHGGYTLPDSIPANQFLTLEGQKLSTSRGHAIWLPEYLESFAPDSLRYALLRNLPEARDADFTWKDFQTWHNNELADILGNFVNRTLMFVEKYYGLSVPVASAFTASDNRMLDLISKAPAAIGDHIEKYEFKAALQELMKLVQEGNRYFDHEEPWLTRKTNALSCERTIGVCMRLVAALGVLAEPFLPFTAERLREMIGGPRQSWDEIAAPRLPAVIGKPQILFRKIENAAIDAQEQKLKKEEISIQDFARVQLKTAKVLVAEPVAGSDHLLRCEIEVGPTRKQIVAGIGEHYRPQDLVGKTIVIVDNLKPAFIKGVASQGMLLAAQDPNDLTLLTTDKPVSTGSPIK